MDREQVAPPESRKTPRGVKLLLGCLGLAALCCVLLAVGVGIGGIALKRGVESAFGGLDEHRAATETLRRVETEHPFEVPPDGVVTEDRLGRYLAVTDAAWADLAKWAEGTARTGGKSGDEDEGRVQGPRIPRLGHGPVPETPGPGMVVAVAVLWGMAEIPTWQAMGLDSFGVPAFR